MKKLFILAHLNAGGSAGRNTLSLLQAECNKKNIEYKVYISQYKKHTKKLVAEIVCKIEDRENSRLVVIGGDGTLNEALESLVSENINFPLAYFPSGTGNDFARSLNLTKDIGVFLDKLFTTAVTNLEIIKAKENYSDKIFVAVNGLGIGFDALVSHLNNSSKGKKSFGKNSYLAQIYNAFKERETFDVKVILDSNYAREYKNVLLTTFMKNSYFGGGIKIDPFSTKNNGEIGVIIAHDISGIDLLKVLPSMLVTGTHFGKLDNFIRVGAKHINLEISSSQFIQADGEVSKLDKINMDIELMNYPFYLVEK